MIRRIFCLQLRTIIRSSLIVFCILASIKSFSQPSSTSIARVWNEATLHAIRNDFARPPIHARNLFHSSIAMYDAWALFDPTAETYLIGKNLNNFKSDFELENIDLAQLEDQKQEVVSYAMYTLLSFRFANSPGHNDSQLYFDSLMNSLGYTIDEISIDYTDGKASSLGNFIAIEILRYGLMDGSNEQNDYANLYYEPVNDPLILTETATINIQDPNRWQPLTFETFIDQSGNLVEGATPPFLNPEWGNVFGFALTDELKKTFSRDDNSFNVYHDPGTPPLLLEGNDSNNHYQWGFSLVSEWGSHLDANDGVMWDISPASIGNSAEYPDSFEIYPNYYLQEGGSIKSGHGINPVTNQPYQPQYVPRGDYTRVLAEFWADGPDSETPPGHWFSILNYVMDHPQFERKFNGNVSIDDSFEYDVKAYFILGAAMHDAAISAWSIKGWYDYIRPISAIRYMASLGQSTDSDKDNYHPLGIPLKEGLIEIIEESDPLASNADNIGKIKLFSWRGHDSIEDPEIDVAGVGWILANDWWPYQRPTFVTPPFAGYISGHSTYSSAAAEVLTRLTGTPYFPGGMGEFIARKNQFLVFEKGPSMDIVLQWATYKDAADQCSLSRIWGGIHPPADDIPGRIAGKNVGENVYQVASLLFEGKLILDVEKESVVSIDVFPNPLPKGKLIQVFSDTYILDEYRLYNFQGALIDQNNIGDRNYEIETNELKPGVYLLKLISGKKMSSFKILIE